MKREFMKKMIQAKKMEVEAFKSLLPEEMQGHLEVIHKEVKDMGKEVLRSCVEEAVQVAKECKEDEDSESKKDEKVQKVTIE